MCELRFLWCVFHLTVPWLRGVYLVWRALLRCVSLIRWALDFGASPVCDGLLTSMCLFLLCFTILWLRCDLCIYWLLTSMCLLYLIRHSPAIVFPFHKFLRYIHTHAHSTWFAFQLILRWLYCLSLTHKDTLRSDIVELFSKGIGKELKLKKTQGWFITQHSYVIPLGKWIREE